MSSMRPGEGVPILDTATGQISMAEAVSCPTCSGSGKKDGKKHACPDCGGGGKVSPETAADLKGAEDDYDEAFQADYDVLENAEDAGEILHFDWATYDAERAAKGLAGTRESAKRDNWRNLGINKGTIKPTATRRHHKLTAAKRKALPDESFAYIDSKGGRHLPVHDSAHVRGALSRFKTQQFESDEAKKAAAQKILTRAKKLRVKTDQHTHVHEAANMAELDAKKRANLDDSDFGYVDEDGKGHFPLHDKTHVEKANQLFTTHSFPDQATKKKTARKIKARAKQHGISIDPDGPVSKAANMSEPWVVALPFSEHSAEAFGEGKPLPFLKIGEHHFPDYGDVNIGPDQLDQVVNNFKAGVRRQDLAIINEEHIPAQYDENGPVMGPGAIGYIQDMYRDGDTVYVTPNWNPAGERIMADDRYRGTSPELMLNWTDPETLQSHGLTAVGLALTNRPRMKNLAVQGQALAASEGTVLVFADAADVHVDGPMPGFSVEYAFPGKKRLPLHSKEAVLGAKARFMTIDATEEEREEAWKRALEAAKGHGVALPPTWRSLNAADAFTSFMASEVATPRAIPGPTEPVPPKSWTSSSQPEQEMQMADDRKKSQNDSDDEDDDNEPTQSDPDGDGDDDSSASGDTDHDVWDEDGKLTPKGLKLRAAGKLRIHHSEEIMNDEDQPDIEASEPDGEQDHVAADFAEVQNLLLAEQRRRRDMERRLALAERTATNAREELQRQETARKLSEVRGRLDTLVASGRCTPAEVEIYSEDGLMVKLAETPKFLEALEARPANSAVDMSERGSGEADDGQISNENRLHQMAISHMEAKGQDTSRRTGKQFSEQYRAALLDVSKTGYRPARA